MIKITDQLFILVATDGYVDNITYYSNNCVYVTDIITKFTHHIDIEEFDKLFGYVNDADVLSKSKIYGFHRKLTYK